MGVKIARDVYVPESHIIKGVGFSFLQPGNKPVDRGRERDEGTQDSKSR